MVNPHELAVLPSAKEEFVSANPEVAVGKELGVAGAGSTSMDFPGSSEGEFAFLAPGETEPSSFHDFEDTLIRTEQASLVRTFAGEGGERLPDSWAVPPGGGVPGGYPGYRREAAAVDYSANTGATYFPPPSVNGPYRGNSHSYPYSGSYHPGGPYAYQYDGMVPLGDPGVYEDNGFEFEGDIPLFTRQFNPEEAHFKAGPLYFQALWVETGVLYSDYHGPAFFAPGEDDGWLGFASFRFRMAAQLGPSLYLTADGELIYLFGENELGFRTGLGGGPFATLVYETQIGSWDFRAYAEFGTGSFYDMFGSDAYERAGRYSFGFYGSYDNDLLYDPYLYTRLGVEASTLVNPDWRLTLTADHTDYWYVGGEDRGDDHSAREHAGVLYGAEPNRVPFTPWFSYDLYSDDYFDTAYHTLYMGGSGRLSENVFFDGRVGYFMTTGDRFDRENWLWNIGLRHRISERTSHGVRFGQDFFMSDFSIDSTVSSFFQYYIEHQFNERLRGRAFAQWSTDEYLSGPLVGGEFETEQYGVWLDYLFTDRLRGSVGYMEQGTRNTRSGYEYNQSIFQARLDAQVGLRSTAYFLYQHEDTDIYYEDLYMAGIRRYF
ncbi:MAG: hypothetical protein KDN18_11095 [Verrucomicrobiae bacterium]|nr:hypothetical protein [Verrucomicrobiae bacterium]